MAAANSERLERTILRRWLKAAARIFSKVSNDGACSSITRGINWTTLDLALGGGVKAEGGRSNNFLVVQSHCAMTEMRPYVLLPSDAKIRSATSFLNISATKLTTF